MYMSIKEAAKYANVNYNAIWNHLVNTGKLEGYKVQTNNKWQSAWRVSKESVDNLYYAVKAGTKQHVAKVPPNDFIFALEYGHPQVPENVLIENAINFLKDQGYKVSKPVTIWEEV